MTTLTCAQSCKHPLYPFQEDVVLEFIEEDKNLFLCDEMGLGKTIQALLIAKEKNLLPCLILCPKSLRIKWANEVKHWTGIDVVLNGEDNDHGLDELIQNPHRFFIVHHDVLSQIDTKPWLELMYKLHWKCVIVDEAHRFRNYDTKRGSVLLKFKNTRRWMFLTGTPIINSTLDIFPEAHLLRPEVAEFSSPGGFISQFCRTQTNQYGMEVYDSKNEDRLFTLLGPHYIRREKQDVLKELPPKVSTTLNLRMDTAQRETYDHFEQYLSMLLDSGEELSSPNVLAQIMRLRQLTLDPRILGKELRGIKTQAVMDLIDAAEHKVVIFSTLAQYINILAKELEEKEIPYLSVTGSADASIESMKFNKSNKYKVYLSTMKKGEGIDLVTAGTVIITDHWWNQATEDQAVDRLHRIGQIHDSIQVITLHCDDTLDDHLVEVLQKKSKMSEKIVVESEVVRAIWQRQKEKQFQMIR